MITILKFWQEGCMFCDLMKKNKSIENLIDRAKEVYEVDTQLRSVDIGTDEGDAEADKYNLKRVPAIFFLDEDGTVLSSVLGYEPLKLRGALKQAVDKQQKGRPS